MIRDARVFDLGRGAGPARAGRLAVAQAAAPVDNNGMLFGNAAQKDGRPICAAPSVWPDFRGLGSFLVCA